MIFVVIPARNRKEYLIQALKSLFDQTYKKIKVIVTDDGSTDGLEEAVSKKFPKVIILKGDGNLWWTGGARKGINYAKKLWKKDDFVLMQNQDTYMPKDYLETLVKESTEHNRIIVGTTTKSFNTKKIIANSHSIVKGLYRPQIVSIDPKSEIHFKTDTLNTRGTLIPVEVFKKLDNFSTTFPHYGADYDFFCRARENGFTLAISNKAVTYSLDDNKGLAYQIKHKDKVSFSDVKDLFLSRRSPNNIYTSVPMITLHVPFPQKLLGYFMYFGYILKFILVDYMFKNIISVFKRNA